MPASPLIMCPLLVVTDSQRILDSIRRLVRFLRLSDRAAQTQAGMSSAQLFVLHELGRTAELSLSDLAQRTLTDQSSVSVVVTRLVEAGFVARDRHPRDARRLALNLTKSGKAVLQNAPPAPQERIIEAIERLPPSDRKRFADLFSLIIEDLGESGGTVAMIEFNEGVGPKERE